ncbi:MAG TPA: NAD-dependent epimerase/dehydratase family protein [Candidatus Eisenbacteria bacterium]|nr:NAD-dependent epimerase/dehydratase family protein [Candidatus Eisenbacteria bacterium]
MKIVLLGGTRFLGRHFVEHAVKAGHAITLFHRGLSGCTDFPEVEHVHGDRTQDLERLGDRTWDAVVDTSGYFPRIVRTSARFFADRAAHYTFVSSLSVYNVYQPGMVEHDDVAKLEEGPEPDAITPENYGALKVLCEKAVMDSFPDRSLHVRAGMIVGPWDYSDRFTYWVRRVSTGGDILVPEPRRRPMQLIHAGDLAAWMLRMVETRGSGIYHATSPQEPWTFEEVLDACREVSGSKVNWVWAPESFFLEHKVEFWQELPLCAPPPDDAVMTISVGKAIADGLTWRRLLITARETLAWDAVRPPGTTLKAGLTPAREVELLDLWRHHT